MSNALHTQYCVKQYGCVMAHSDSSVPEFPRRLNPDVTTIGFVDFRHVGQAGAVGVHASIPECGEPFQNGFDAVIEKRALSGCAFAIVSLRPQWARAEFVDVVVAFHHKRIVDGKPQKSSVPSTISCCLMIISCIQVRLPSH